MEERRKKEKNKIKEKLICYNCKKEGHIKRNCPEIKCFYCNGNHLKKHCIKYFLNLRYKKWINKKEKYIKPKENQKEPKEAQEIMENTTTDKNKEDQEKLQNKTTSTTEQEKNAKELKQNPQQRKRSPKDIKTQKETEITNTKNKTNPEEKRKKWLLKDTSNSKKKNIPWNKEYKEKEKKKIELQAKLEAENQDKEIQDLEKKIEEVETIHKNRIQLLENMTKKYRNLNNETKFEEASSIIDLFHKDQKLSMFLKTILLINQRFEIAEEKKLQHRNIYYDIKDLEKYIREGDGKQEGPLSKKVIKAIPEQAKNKWEERLRKLKEW